MALEADLIVGIDVGMSCTGVAYLNKARGIEVVQVFQAWPGKIQENKVPTRLSYDMASPNKAIRWGFQCAVDSDRPVDIKIEEWFKHVLGEDGQDDVQDHIRKLYTDYLENLYVTLMDYFGPTVLFRKQWKTANIEFLFSVPATWNTDTVDVFKRLAFDAGFGQCPTHKVSASLTEPQAVAAFTLSEEKMFQNGETILIADAGGGTLDLCLLTIDNVEESKVSTTELKPVLGKAIGSTYIDSEFQEIVKRRLQSISGSLNNHIDTVAWQMRNSQAFQANKHELGKSRYEKEDVFRIKIPDMKEVLTDRSLRIKNGEMEFEWGELEKLFDRQIEGMKCLITEMLDSLSLSHGKPVNHLIMSGGLGSSRYVQAKMSAFCANRGHSMLRASEILVSTEPQLAVCRGLVNHAKQHVSMFPRRCARASYGIPCRIKYGSSTGDRWKTIQEMAKRDKRITTDEFNQKWIENCMDWFVTKGSRVCDGERTPYKYMVPFDPSTPADERVCRVHIMTCLDSPPPPFQDKGRVRSQAIMEVNLSRVKERHVGKGLFKQMIGRKHFIQVEFTIEAVVGAAEVSFRCYDKDKTPLSNKISLALSLGGDVPGKMKHAQLARVN